MAVRANVVAVRIYYCDKAGDLHEEWVDMTNVKGIAWNDAEAIPTRGSGPSHTGKIPKKSDFPNLTCVTGLADPSGLCWWTGSAWSCGD